MDRLQCVKSGKTIILYDEVANSGEGKIYQTSEDGFLAKIYHSCSQEKINKLQIMIENPPKKMTLAQSHISIAWPMDLLKDTNGKYLGFLMPEIQGSQTLTNIYNPSRRKKIAPEINWKDLHSTALHLSFLIELLHSSNYVIGDLKPENLLTNKQTFVSIIDTDSFQVVDPRTGKIYLSPVASSEFTSPEMFGENVETVGRSKVQDYFSLAIIIWLLLFGYHPFSGKWLGDGNQPSIDKLIHDGFWMYGKYTYKIRPGKFSMPLDIIHPSLQKCFQQCFDEGHSNPLNRPNTTDWIEALTKALKNLKHCSIDSGHYYTRKYGKCYWCERKQQLRGIDIFEYQPSPHPIRTDNPVILKLIQFWRDRSVFCIKAIKIEAIIFIYVLLLFFPISLTFFPISLTSIFSIIEQRNEDPIIEKTNEPSQSLTNQSEQDLRKEMNQRLKSLNLGKSDKSNFYKKVDLFFYQQHPDLEGLQLTDKPEHQTYRKWWLEIAISILKNK